ERAGFGSKRRSSPRSRTRSPPCARASEHTTEPTKEVRSGRTKSATRDDTSDRTGPFREPFTDHERVHRHVYGRDTVVRAGANVGIGASRRGDELRTIAASRYDPGARRTATTTARRIARRGPR